MTDIQEKQQANNSQVDQVRADFVVSRTGADGQMADALKFTINGSRCGTLSDLGRYMHNLIDAYIERLSPGGLEMKAMRKQLGDMRGEIERLRREIDEGWETEDEETEKNKPAPKQSSAPIPRARHGR